MPDEIFCYSGNLALTSEAIHFRLKDIPDSSVDEFLPYFEKLKLCSLLANSLLEQIHEIIIRSPERAKTSTF